MTVAGTKMQTSRSGAFPLALGLFCAATLAAGWAGSARASSLRCDLSVSSRDGGALNLTGGDIPAQFQQLAANFWATWRPPASNRAVELDILWNQDNLERLGPADNAGISFTPPRGVARKDVSVSFRTGDGRTWIAPSAALTYGETDAHGRRLSNAAQLAFRSMGQDGADLLQAIQTASKLDVVIKAKGRPYLDTAFDLSGLAARDALFVQARDRVRAADPKACITKRQKIHYDTPTPLQGRRTYKAECVGPDGKTTLKSVTLDKPPVYDICG